MSKPFKNRPFRFWISILLLFTAGTAAFLISPVSAEKPVVTIIAQGAGSYYLGEEVVISGMNTDSGSTYLYITGPNLPDGGGKLSSPSQKAVSGNAGSFTVVKTKPDKTWEYPWFTSGLKLDAGTYTLYAASGPKTGDQLADVPYGTTGIIIKKPFISAEISPSSVSKGQPFTVTGTAEGIPDKVQVWIFGDNYVSTAKATVNQDASFTFKGDAAMSGKLPKGQNYLIVQHPMQNNQFDIAVSGDYVRNVNLNNGTNLFKITGAGSLQGSDAVEALIVAFNENGAPRNDTYTRDTFTVIPFQVTDTGSSASRIPAATTVPASGTPAGTGVTISTDGDKSYYLGEKVVVRGQNAESDSTYLFITGPDTFKDGPGIPAEGGKLTSPLQRVVSGDPDSFTVVKTNPDKTWEYAFYTANLPVDAGTYNLYAVSRPQSLDKAGPAAAGVGIILKKPFITAKISSPDVVKGQPFSVTGTAEGIPDTVQIWIFGDNYVSTAKATVNQDASFAFNSDAAMSGKLPAGQNWLIVQHPMQNNQFDIAVSGDYVRDIKQNDGTNLFKITGSGSLQGGDAVEALLAAFSDKEAHDTTYTVDTFTVIPFKVTDAGSSAAGAPAVTTVPAQQPTQHVPLQYAAPIGAGALVLAGIVLWKRH